MVLFLGMAGLVSAATEPLAPRSLTEVTSSTFNVSNYALQSHNAIAGNITGLVIDAIGQTKAWQGYYGNITGTITLDDVNNYTFYNWTSAEPQGQIYATLNTTITWTSVDCYNFTAGGGFATWQTIEDYYGIQTDDVDGVNETFNETTHPVFEVGSKTISGCPTAYVFQNETIQAENFVNVLLYDNTTINETGWIYMTMIENKTSGATNDLLCYNGEECDFQILVNEDGHGNDTQTTTYYFWVELL